MAVFHTTTVCEIALLVWLKKETACLCESSLIYNPHSFKEEDLPMPMIWSDCLQRWPQGQPKCKQRWTLGAVWISLVQHWKPAPAMNSITRSHKREKWIAPRYSRYCRKFPCHPMLRSTHGQLLSDQVPMSQRQGDYAYNVACPTNNCF